MIKDAVRTAAAAAIAGVAIAYLVACSVHRDLKPQNMIRRPRTGTLR